jgi:hypothetical protein
MKSRLVILLLAFAFIASAAIYGFTTTTPKTKAADNQAATKECTMVKHCPKEGQADCPLVQNCPKKGQEDCPFRSSVPNCCAKKAATGETASK